MREDIRHGLLFASRNVPFGRRRFLAASSGLAASLLAQAALAQPAGGIVRVVVPFPPGGGTDVLARVVADKLRGGYAPAVIVDNRPGAGGRLGVSYVKAAEADGNTILCTPDSVMTVYPHSYRKLAYDPLTDFMPVAVVAKSQLALCAGPGLPEAVKTVPQFVQWCRANPSRATYATTSAGAIPHFIGVMLARAARLELTPVHYKGGAAALQDLMGGHIPVSVNPVGEVLPYVDTGKLRVLATTGPARSRFLPKIPTLAEESDYRDIVVEGWIGFFAPAKTPAATVGRLSAAIADAVKAEEVVQSILKFGSEPWYVGPEPLATLLRDDIERWRPVVKASGFTAED
jgi:tripartite-type tricarboxylate transporter receptor subunit TctC